MADPGPEPRSVQTAEGRAEVRIRLPRGRPRGTVLLSHGAGGTRDSADLAALALALPEAGWLVGLVDQPWRVAGRRVAPRPVRLDAAYGPVVAALFDCQDPLPRPFVSAGRSAGARVVCRTAAHVRADAIVAISFPLHPPGQPERSRYAELEAAARLPVPLWVVQGERDTFGTPAEIVAAGLDPGLLRSVRGTHTPHAGDVVAAVLGALDRLGS